MSVVHTEAVRNAMAGLVLSQLDDSLENGYLEFQTASGRPVARLDFSRPAFLPPVGGSSFSNEIESDIDAEGGRVAQAVFKSGDGEEKFRVSVTSIGGGGDIEIEEIEVGPGREVFIEGPLMYVAAP